MQDFQGSKTGSNVQSKISVKEGAKGAGLGLGGAGESKGDAITKPGNKGGATKGFSGGLINPKIK